MKSQKQAVALLAFLLTFVCTSLFAAVPSEINFQARITDSLGNPINDTVDITIKIYDDPFTPTEKWSETHPMIPLVDIEIVQLQLSSITPFPVDIWASDEVWMGITVDTDPEITPRLRVLAVPFAHRAEGVDGHIKTDIAEVLILGQPSNPPELIIQDDPSVTPTVEELVRLSDLSVALITNRGPGDKDSTELKADGLRIFNPDGSDALSFTPGSVTFDGVPVDFDGTEASWLASGHTYVRIDSTGMKIESEDAAPIPPIELPDPEIPFIAISDDILNQLFAAIIEPGRLTATNLDSGLKVEIEPSKLKMADLDGVKVEADIDLGDGLLRLRGTTLSEFTSLRPDLLQFTQDDGVTFGSRLSYGGLEIHGGSVDLLSGTDLTVTGTLDLTGGTLDLSSSGLSVGLDLDVGGHLVVGSTLTVNDGGSSNTEMTPIRVRAIDGAGNSVTMTSGSLTFDHTPPSTSLELGTGGSGGTLTLSGGTGGGLIRLTADDLEVENPSGDLSVSSGSLLLEPSGGGAGGRVTLSSSSVVLTDDLSSDVLTLDRTGGSVLLLATGETAYYRADGVQLTGPDVRRLSFDRTGITLTRPSLNDALVCRLDDASDLLYCDLDDDGARDIRFEHTPSKALHLVTGTELRCDDLATFAQAVQINSDLTVTGTLDLSGGTLDLGSSSLTIGGDLQVGGSLSVDAGTITTDGAGTLTLDAGSSTLTLSESGVVSDLGSVRIDDASGIEVLSTELRASDLTLTSGGLDMVRLSNEVGGAGGGRIDLSDGTAGTLILDGASLTLDDGTTTPLVLERGGSGGSVTLTGGAGGGSVSLSADDLSVLHGSGDLRVNTGTLTLEPSGGGSGGRIVVSSGQLTVADDLGTGVVTLHRTGGVGLLDNTGRSITLSTTDGLLLVDTDGSRFAGTSRSVALGRPSLNDAMVCTIDDPNDVMYCDLDDDGLRDIRCQYLPTKELVLESGTSLRCDGPTTMSSCDVSGPATYASSVEVSGTMQCRSTWTCDPDDDATPDVYCDDLAPGPRLVVASSAELRCDGPSSLTDCSVSGTLACNDLECVGPASFAQPVQVNSDLTVTGQLQVFGPKAFVQQHPEDASKEVVYVALEGNEAGTYTRGSSQLVDGVAEIELPEDFRLVTNVEGLTAQITPRGPVQSMLYVESITPTKLVVKASNKKDGSVKFDFMVNGVRSGFENHQVIREKKSVAMAD